MKFSFFHQRHALLTSFDIFVATYRGTNFLPKLIDTLLFSAGKKTEFPFFELPYFQVLPKFLCLDHDLNRIISFGKLFFFLEQQTIRLNFLYDLDDKANCLTKRCFLFHVPGFVLTFRAAHTEGPSSSRLGSRKLFSLPSLMATQKMHEGFENDQQIA